MLVTLDLRSLLGAFSMRPPWYSLGNKFCRPSTFYNFGCFFSHSFIGICEIAFFVSSVFFIHPSWVLRLISYCRCHCRLYIIMGSDMITPHWGVVDRRGGAGDKQLSADGGCTDSCTLSASLHSWSIFSTAPPCLPADSQLTSRRRSTHYSSHPPSSYITARGAPTLPLGRPLQGLYQWRRSNL